MINCPSNVYINTKKFNINLFRNICNILDENGILTFRISLQAIESILNVITTDFIYIGEKNEKQDGTLLTEDEIKEINSKILQEHKNNINLIREHIKDYFKTYDIPLILLDIEQNNQYISNANIKKDDDSFALYQFFVFKKINNSQKEEDKGKSKSKSKRRRLNNT